MTITELLAYHDHMTSTAKSIMVRKNHDYAGSSGTTPFSNFTMCEAARVTSTERGMLVRLLDKIARLSTFCEGGILKVSDESVDDTLQDIINYSVLFGGYVKEKRDLSVQPTQSEEEAPV